MEDEIFEISFEFSMQDFLNSGSEITYHHPDLISKEGMKLYVVHQMNELPFDVFLESKYFSRKYDINGEKCCWKIGAGVDESVSKIQIFSPKELKGLEILEKNKLQSVKSILESNDGLTKKKNDLYQLLPNFRKYIEGLEETQLKSSVMGKINDGLRISLKINENYENEVDKNIKYKVKINLLKQ
jgi:hypothetical protein